MDVRVASAILKLQGRSDPRVRLILASMSTDYDRFLRLQVLEGAAGVQPDTWWQLGKNGLKRAEQYFRDRGYHIDQRWLAEDYTEVYSVVLREIRRALDKTGIQLDPYEVIHNYLMGMSITNPDKFRKTRPVFEVGRRLSDQILSGKLSPKVVANNVLQSYMVRGIFTEARGSEKFEQIPDSYKDVPAPVSDAEAGDFLLAILFWNPRDPLGKKIRDFMRKTWAGTGQESSMNAWLAVVEQDGRIPSKKEIAEQTGISSQAFIQRHWGASWKRFFDALWANQNLLTQLQKRYEMEGLPWFQEKPDPRDIFSPDFRRRRASRSDRWEMNLRTANAVLKLLKTSKTKDPRVRVATRWILANMADDYDKMLRAQVLEGAAGVRIDSWWKKSQRGLDQAKEFFENQGVDIKPAWFDKTYSGMYGILSKAVGKTLSKSGVSFEPLDIINNALMGLSLTGGSGQKRPPYEAGKNLAADIKDGKETPRSVAGGKLGAYLVRKVLGEAKTIKYHENLPEGLEGEELEIADTSAEKKEAGEFLLNIVLWQPHDPLGKKIRDFMRKTWAGTGQESSMNYWLSTIEQDGRIPTKNEVAKAVGVTPQTFIQRHWGAAWKRFFDALWANQNLLAQLQKRYEMEGLPWFQEKPDPEEVFQIRTRKASDLMIQRVVTRWIRNPA